MRGDDGWGEGSGRGPQQNAKRMICRNKVDFLAEIVNNQ